MEQFFNIPGFYHIGETILMFLDHEELLCLQCVSRSFNNYLKNNTELWLKKCLQRNIPRKFYAKWKELIEQVDDINTGKGPYTNYVDRQGVGGDAQCDAYVVRPFGNTKCNKIMFKNIY